MKAAMTPRPRITLKKDAHRRIVGGHPWVFSNEVMMDVRAKAIPPGAVVTVDTAGGDAVATAHFKPHTLIAARVLDRARDAVIDQDWLRARLAGAAALRDRLFGEPYYRLAHAEADGLPGLIIDRFGDVAVVQPNTAGMDAAVPAIIDALRHMLPLRAVVVRGESGARRLEGLADRAECLLGALDGAVGLRENGLAFFADPMAGQKTGWFFDQRDNRALAATLTRGFGADARVLDLFTHTGGFAIACAAAGAATVVAVDSSAPALDLAARAAAANALDGRCRFERADVFDYLEAATETYDLVIADPPTFAKSRKDMKVGLQGYRKLARLAARRVAPGGMLMIASCSHHAALADFTAAVTDGLGAAGRPVRIVRSSGAALDHPVHPGLPETAYLKMLTLALDHPANK